MAMVLQRRYVEYSRRRKDAFRSLVARGNVPLSLFSIGDQGLCACYVPVYGTLEVGNNEESDQERSVEVGRRHQRKRQREEDEIDDVLVQVYENRCNMMNNFVVQLYRKELPTLLSQQAASSLPAISSNSKLGNVTDGNGCTPEMTHCSGQELVGVE